MNKDNNKEIKRGKEGRTAPLSYLFIQIIELKSKEKNIP